MISRDWITGRTGTGSRQGRMARAPYRWMTTLPAPLATVRASALQALAERHATVAYLYQTDDKVVIRATLAQRQIRAELRSLDARSTRIVVVTLHGAEVDRHTSGQIVDAIEHKVQNAG